MSVATASAPHRATPPHGRWAALGAGPRRGRPALDGHPHPLLSAVALLVISVWVPAHQSSLNVEGGYRLFVALAAVALAFMVRTPRGAWSVRLLVAAAAGAAVLVPEGEIVAVMLPASLLLGTWCVADRPPLPLPGRMAPAMTLPVLVLSLAAGRAGEVLGAKWEPISLLVLAGLVLLAAQGRRVPGATTVERAVSVLDRAALSLLSAGLLGVAAMARVAGRPFARTVSSFGGGWVPVPAVGPDPDRPGDVRTHSVRRRRDGRAPVFAASVLVVAVVVAGVLATSPTMPWTDSSDGIPDLEAGSAAELGVPSPDDEVPAAYAGDGWYPGFRLDMAWVTDERVAWRPMAVQRVLDVETPTVNVHDRVRDTWYAPECDCRRVSLWLYGGSGAFGLGQRDEHTIASELARAAWEDGIALDVQNRGVPGQMHWRNATRFAWDLTVVEAPDMVLFYDGAEEVESELELRERGLGDTRAPVESFLTDLYDEVVDVPDDPEPPEGVDMIGWPTVGEVPAQPGALAAARYDRSREMSRGTASAAGIPVRYVWQPSRYQSGGSEAEQGDPDRRAAFIGAAAALPDDVQQIHGALSEFDEPVFLDDSIHEEDSARALAEAIWAGLRDQVTALAGR